MVLDFVALAHDIDSSTNLDPVGAVVSGSSSRSQPPGFIHQQNYVLPKILDDTYFLTGHFEGIYGKMAVFLRLLHQKPEGSSVLQ